MELKQLVQELKQRKLRQTTTTPDVIKAEIVRQVIYRRADFISQGLKLVGVRQFSGLDVKYQYPSEMTMEYPVAEGARGGESKINWTTFYMEMQKAEGRFLITDEATMRQLENIQYETGVRRLSEALAKAKDDNIISTLHDYAHTTSVAASASWPAAAATSIVKDIKNAINLAVQATGVQPDDIKNMALVLPIRAWTPLLSLTEVENIRIQLGDYIQRSYGLSLHPTKNSTLVNGNKALLMIKGPDTAIHGVAAAHPKVPLVEVKRITGVGLEYTVRQFFATRVIPDSSTTSTSQRIIKISGVTA